MPKKILLAGAIIIILILIGISFGYGYWLGAREKVREVPRILGLETSAVIKSQHATAEGEIIEILNRILTLTANGDELEIPIGDEARIIVFEEGVNERIMEPREIEFKDLKIGDKVEVLLELKPDGDFVGIHIIASPE